ncbi:hypothetical protein N7533_003865 [Penicillium manginii]|uniref:uncharacterized protein n=1 Tax=Penicillium manginii TaxID=203109 RepID=UPI002549AB92|nr:uncharacterized protein N7533_003865 [Penicillium manginii]KAJ5754322.1 hypothetical protein N7533_003865 [Penicillium manginii]
MVRGAEYDNGIPQSDNPIENGPNKAHGVGATDAPVNRASKVAPMPAETGSERDVFPGLSHAGPGNSGSGKGGHEPKSLGENKGTGAQGV